MAFSKADQYPDIYRRPAQYARTLSHPERIAIIHLLHENGALTVNDIVRNSPLSQPVVSQHLGILRRSGVVSFRLHAPFIEYHLEYDELHEAFACLTSSLTQVLTTPNT